MKNETRMKMEGGLLVNVGEYLNESITNVDKKTRELNILAREVKMLREEESAEVSDELKKRRQTFDIQKGEKQLKLEEERLNHSTKIEDEKLELDKTKIDLETKKYESSNKIEDEKLELDKTKIDLETKKYKSSNKIETKKLELDKTKIDLETKKYESSNKIETQKLELEGKKLDHLMNVELLKLELEKSKIQLEYAKLDSEKVVKEEERKKEKKNFLFNVISKAAEITIPLAVNAAIILMSFRLVYVDDGRVPTEMRELFKKLK